jgi:hypothetical protein
MKFAQLFLLVLAFLMIKPANAGLLIEPVIGYTFAKSEVDAPGFSENKSQGPSYGGRLGYQNLGFQLGLDYLSSTLNVDSSKFKSDMNVKEFAGFVGFEFPILLRAYAGYIFSATADSDVNIGAGKQSLDLSSGKGMKLGVGFTGLPFVDINFEYRKGTFSEMKLGGVKSDIDTDYSAYMISASLPFVL